jgi:hypothetical protein
LIRLLSIFYAESRDLQGQLAVVNGFSLEIEPYLWMLPPKLEEILRHSSMNSSEALLQSQTLAEGLADLRDSFETKGHGLFFVPITRRNGP